MDRLACNLDDLRRLVQKLTKRGVHIEFLKEGLVFTGDDSPMANLMLSVMGPSRSSSERSFVSDSARASPWPSNVVLTGAARNPCPTNRPSQSDKVPLPASRTPSWPVSSV
ncbi:Mobile element protein [Pseudomonas chlororaphis]|uniref:Mobile element protein n=1 Tax=Pseudomonas chlororaphis TaxID=587753 RepID=A0A3G7TTI7_9PSED|nr:Mobile element protein [Pseudomonas chlororaphis]